MLNKAEEHAVLIHISDHLSFIFEVSLALHEPQKSKVNKHRNILVTIYQTALLFHVILSFTFCKYKTIPFQLQGKNRKLRLCRMKMLEKRAGLQRVHEFWVCFRKVRTET